MRDDQRRFLLEVFTSRLAIAPHCPSDGIRARANGAVWLSVRQWEFDIPDYGTSRGVEDLVE